MGYLDGVLCTFCWTMRGHRMRIIPMRKVNDRERRAYARQAL
ncbi:BrnT family toxin [Mangrovicella endophytica]